MKTNKMNMWATVEKSDTDLFDQHLRSFVPPGTFDAHCHLYRLDHLGTVVPPLLVAGPDVVDRSTYDRCVSDWMVGCSPTSGLFSPLPAKTMDRQAANDCLSQQIRIDPGSRGMMVIAPTDDPADVSQYLAESELVGFKACHVFSNHEDSFHVPTESFLPQWAWQIAHERSLVIMLNIVFPKALTDPVNQSYIRKHCCEYPNAKLILAHAASGFSSQHTVEGIKSLRGLDNVFFDTSAVCEPAAYEEILRTFGATRLLYGSDFPVTELRTRRVNLGDGFAWLHEISEDYSTSLSAHPTMLGIESLLALKQACRNQHLNDSDIEQVFCRSARDLLGITATNSKPDVQQAYLDAKTIIPGGTQLRSKRPETFAPQRWPAYYDEAHGCEMIDIQGNRYVDMSSCGILSTILGFADPDVNAAVIRRVHKGSMCTQQTFDEIELARLLIEYHPWAEMARFARTGGESMAIAVRIARAATGRDKIAFCGYHGWHDWYLAANLVDPDEPRNEERVNGHLLPGLDPAGVPRALAGTAWPFCYNQLDELDMIIAKHGRDIAAIVMEPTRYDPPEKGFLDAVRQRCNAIGAKLIFDEITVGWRLCISGAHILFGVEPDMAVFAKAISNGYPMAAIIGNADTMNAVQNSFISSTYWTEGIGSTAALATLRKMKRVNLPVYLEAIGRRMIQGWEKLGRQHDVPLATKGWSQCPRFVFEHPEATALSTLFTSRMLDRGFLAANVFNVMYAHENRHVDAYLDAADDVFAELGAAIKDENIQQRLQSPVKYGGFARIT